MMGRLKISCRADRKRKPVDGVSATAVQARATQATASAPQAPTLVAPTTQDTAASSTQGVPSPVAPHAATMKTRAGDVVVDAENGWVLRRSRTQGFWYLVAPGEHTIRVDTLKSHIAQLPL